MESHSHGEGHGHPHDHAHGPGEHTHDHSQCHGTGFLGWLRGTFGHSHDIGDKVFLFIVRGAAKAVWNRLVDGIEPSVVREIEHAPAHVPGVREVREVRARWVGLKVFTDLQILVDPDLSVAQSQEIVEAVKAELRRHVRSLGSAVVSVHPAAQ